MQNPPTNIKVFTDGASRGNPGAAAAAFVVIDSNDQVIHEQADYLGLTTNNTAEYTALLHASTWLISGTLEQLYPNGVAIQFFADSELMVKQINGIYKIKEPHIQNLASQILPKLKQLSNWSLSHIPRSANKHADLLCNQTLDNHVQNQ